MSADDDAAAGVRLAQLALHASADGEDDKILELINAGTHAETAWAAAYLVSVVRETVWLMAGGKPRKAATALHAAADNLEDGLMVRLDLMLDKASRDKGQ